VRWFGCTKDKGGRVEEEHRIERISEHVCDLVEVKEQKSVKKK